MKLNKLAFASLLAASMGYSATASAADYTFCDAGGLPFCDGVSIAFNPGNLSGVATTTGCLTGSGAGGIAYHIASGGAGVSVGWSTTADYNISGLPSTEVSITNNTWRHIDLGGGTFNSGTLCPGLPAAAAAGNASSVD